MTSTLEMCVTIFVTVFTHILSLPGNYCNRHLSNSVILLAATYIYIHIRTSALNPKASIVSYPRNGSGLTCLPPIGRNRQKTLPKKGIQPYPAGYGKVPIDRSEIISLDCWVHSIETILVTLQTVLAH